MRKCFYIILIALITVTTNSCNSGRYTTTRHVKPLNRNTSYNRATDRRKKRTHMVKKKILKRSPEIKPKKRKPPKKKSVRQDSTQAVQSDSLSIQKNVSNEPDSTGLF